MKLICGLIYFVFLLIFNQRVIAQGIDWDKVYFGGFIQYSLTEEDLNKYWGNFFSPGILIQYKIDNRFIFEAGVSGSYLKPDEKDKSMLPDITLVNSAAILTYIFIAEESFNINISPGLTNTAFIFTGDAAEKVDNNFIEYEFGIYLSAGVEFKFTEMFTAEPFLSGQNIFSSPSGIVLYTMGVKLIFK
jgi:hypothetical protein